jgi:hypothetical protein
MTACDVIQMGKANTYRLADTAEFLNSVREPRVTWLAFGGAYPNKLIPSINITLFERCTASRLVDIHVTLLRMSYGIDAVNMAHFEHSRDTIVFDNAGCLKNIIQCTLEVLQYL